MTPFKQKAALGISAVSLALAFVCGVAAWLYSRDNAENTMVAVAVEDSRRLLQQEAFELSGPQTALHAQAAAQALAGGLFDVVALYNASGVLIAEQKTETGHALDQEFGPRVTPVFRQSYFESQALPGKRQLLRLYIVLHSADQKTTGYVQGARLLPDWQRDLIEAEALKSALLAALTVLLGGIAMYGLFLRLFAQTQAKTREVLESHLALMQALGRAIARRDSDTGAHNYRVAWIAATLAEAVGLHGSRMQELIVGSFLHDVGKIGIPDQLLLKPERLSEEEMAVMRTHVGLGEDIVAGAGWLAGGQAVVAAHHEKWDGTGYPRGLAGQDIALIARIFAIADVFDALCSQRPHKQPLPLPEVMQAINAGAGSHFDPHLVKVFTDLSGQIYRTLTHTSEAQARDLLEAMVRKHFVL
jgi:HD-GYP domain-containing protein (c-di-GMP phosphodiesterase class II)